MPHNGPTVIAIAALDAGGAHASGDLRSRPGGFSGRLTAGQRHARRARSTSRRRGRRSGSTRTSPPTAPSSRAPSRCAAAAPTAPSSSPTSAPPSTDSSTRAASTSAGSRSPGSPPMPSWSTAADRSAPPSPAAAAPPSLSRHWPISRPTRSASPAIGRIERQPLVLNQAAVLTRSGDGWALAPTNLSFAGGNATVSGRSGSRARSPCTAPGHAAAKCSTSLWPHLDLSGSATGRLDYAWKGNRSGRLDLKIRGLSHAGLVLASKPIDVGIAAIVNGNQAGAASGCRQRRRRSSAVRRRASRRWRRPADDRVAQCAFVRPASLRRTGRYLVAPDGQRESSTCRDRSRSARTSAAGWPTQ